MDRYAHRKSKGVIRLRDKTGGPLPGKKVSLKLLRHEFLFGCGAFDSLPLVDGNENDPEMKAFFRERMEKWASLLNYGTLPFYWGRYEHSEGDVREESRKKAARFLKEHGAKVKGHPLCWHTACADWLMDYDHKTILEKQLGRIDRDVRAFAGLIDIWDVINEAVIMPDFDRYDNAVTRICRDLGRVGLIREVFAAAVSANPGALLLINDFDLSDRYRDLIGECLSAGVPIGAIGLQTHQHQGYKGKEWLEEVLERFSVFGLPLHFTENTLVSGHLMPPHIVDLNDYQVEEWPTTPEGEARQAEEWEEMIRILFSHPLVEAVTGWDFADGGWLNAPSGLIRRDNTEKPAYKTLFRLIHEEWTTEAECVTDAEGRAEFEGYRGVYEAECMGTKASFILTKDSPSVCLSL